MLNICCIRAGTTRGPEYVDILFDMVRRNLPEGMEGRFVCFTDQPDELHPDIVRRPLVDSIFELGLFPDGDKIFYLELETCIIGPLDRFVQQDHPTYCGHGLWPLAAAVWMANDSKLEWQTFNPDWVVAYSGDTFPAGAKIVSFTPSMPPDQCGGWVKEVWKIGGGTCAEMTFVPNVSYEQLVDHIRSACKRRCCWVDFTDAHNRVAVIVGGGPSLARDLPMLKALQRNGAQIFALNNVPRFLIDNGIKPDAHVLLDALPWVADFVSPDIRMRRYYASQCDPSVLDMAGNDLICWHAGMMGLDTVVPEAIVPHIGGGSTVATRAMSLIYELGYRTMHMMGVDSSLENGKAHAYDQIAYEKVLEVRCGSEIFHASPQLLGQAEDFKRVAMDLIAARCEIVVHGTGLIPAIASRMVAH